MPIVVAALLATFTLSVQTVASTSFRLDSVPSASLSQGIIGNATIAPYSPLCGPIPPQPAPGPSLNMTSIKGKPLLLVEPLNWTLFNGCVLFVSFKVSLKPGIYNVTLSPCPFICGPPSTPLPITVDVDHGLYTPIVINVITGIV